MNDSSVVVGADGSPAAAGAVDWAADAAARLGMPLRIVHASVWGSYSPQDEALGDSVVADAFLRASLRQPAVGVSTEVVLGEPEPTLLRESDHADMLVLGSRTLGTVAKAVSGAVSLPVVAQARCPVVVVRGDVPVIEGGDVVLAISGHEDNAAVAQFAFREAAARGCPVRAVHAWTVPWAESATAHTGRSDDARQSHPAQAHQLLEESVASAGRKYPRVPVHRILGEGRAPETLLDAAENAALLVVGARRREHRFGLRIGPVNHAVLHHAPCPVAVVPHD